MTKIRKSVYEVCVLVAALEVQIRNGVQIDEIVRNMFKMEAMSMKHGRNRKN